MIACLIAAGNSKRCFSKGKDARMTEPVVLYEERGSVAIITLNRPECCIVT